jgi:hypothetical protein
MQKNHYEVHLTVLPSYESDIVGFQRFCAEHNVKTIVIDLYAHSQKTQRDIMTSSKMHSTEEEAFLYAKKLGNQITHAGFTLCRTKIESDPFHKNAPQTVSDVMPKNCYFESHIPVQVFSGKESFLHEIVSNTEARISKNPFKIQDGYAISMVTLRDYVSPFCVFKGKLTETLSLLAENQFEIAIGKKIEVEFAVFDSNWKHDHAWIVGV